jgi:hypothetical protein
MSNHPKGQTTTTTPSAAEMRTALLTSLSKPIRQSTLLDELAACIRREALSGDALLELSKSYRWDRDQIVNESPAVIASDESGARQQLLSLFDPSDMLLAGNAFEMEEPQLTLSASSLVQGYYKHISTLRPFVAEEVHPGESTMPALVRRFLVISTTIYDDEYSEGAVVQWLAQQFGMELLAVTADLEGLYGWFSPVSEDLCDALEFWLPAFGLSGSDSFAEEQRLMVPGSASYAQLLYINKPAATV